MRQLGHFHFGSAIISGRRADIHCNTLVNLLDSFCRIVFYGGIMGIPSGYRSALDIRQTQIAIKEVKDHFERSLAS